MKSRTTRLLRILSDIRHAQRCTALRAARAAAEADAVLAPALPPTHVLQAPGGHDWSVWRPLFARFLDDSDFSRACAVR